MKIESAVRKGLAQIRLIHTTLYTSIIQYAHHMITKQESIMALLVNLNLNINISAPRQLLHHHHHRHHRSLNVFSSLKQLLIAQHNHKTLSRKPAAARCCQSESRTILWSDVKVKKERRRTTKWSSLDLAMAGVVLAMHVLCLFAPSTFSWGALWAAVTLYIVTGLFGITLSFHRNLAHRSFKLPKWLEYLFAYCGVQALQGNPMDWVSTHRYHHQYCDSDRDPHSPVEGFWFSHMSWLFDTAYVAQRVSNAGLLRQCNEIFVRIII